MTARRLARCRCRKYEKAFFDAGPYRLLLLATFLFALLSPAPSAAQPDDDFFSEAELEENFNRIADRYFAPFIHDALGWSANVTQHVLAHMEDMFQDCYMRVRVAKGRVLYRARLLRNHPGMELRQYGVLTELKDLVRRRPGLPPVDFLVGVCEFPSSADSTFLIARPAGFPLFSPHASPITVDIPYPDVVGVAEGAYPSRFEGPPVSWDERLPMAVFRGAANNFDLFLQNWLVSPRVQLAMIGARHPNLMDVGLTHVLRAPVCAANQTQYHCATEDRMQKHCCVPEGKARLLRSAGIDEKPPLSFHEMAAYRYVVKADANIGETRSCGYHAKLGAVVLSQDSPFSQYFAPLLQPNVHYVPVRHNWHDLVDKINWLRDNDDRARDIAESG